MKLFKLFQRQARKLPSEMSVEDFDALITNHQTRIGTMTTEVDGLRKDRFKNLRKLGLGLAAGVGAGALVFSGLGLVGVVAVGWVFCLAEGLDPLVNQTEKVLRGFSTGPSTDLLREHWALTQAQANKDRFFPPTPEALKERIAAQSAKAAGTVAPAPVETRPAPSRAGFR